MLAQSGAVKDHCTERWKSSVFRGNLRSMAKYTLVIDQGTTSTRTILFDQKGQPAIQAQQEFTQIFPKDGWVEHDAEEIWQTVKSTTKEAMVKSGADAADIAAIGITNQRETTVLWNRNTGQPVSNAIVWQDRRTAAHCASLHDNGYEAMITEKTGLILDPYFSATKLAWMLDNVEGVRARAENGELAFGTIDCWLLHKLTEGRAHKTDATNAARTMLYNIHSGEWDEDILKLLNIPAEILPEVCDTSSDFGMSHNILFDGSLRIAALVGDQQAASIGQLCFEPGMIKSTYGTGCFALVNTGEQVVASKNRLLSTIAYQFDGKPTYAIEGSIFNAGTAIQWLRDNLHAFGDARESEALARAANEDSNVIFVPAFTGLGAPHWDSEARGSIFGIARDTGLQEITRAALEAVCYQTSDLVQAMTSDMAGAGLAAPSMLRVDGGMVANDWMLQFLTDILDMDVQRPQILETTALGAAFAAGSHVGFYPALQDLADMLAPPTRFSAVMPDSVRQVKQARWRSAIQRTLGSLDN